MISLSKYVRVVERRPRLSFLRGTVLGVVIEADASRYSSRRSASCHGPVTPQVLPPLGTLFKRTPPSPYAMAIVARQQLRGEQQPCLGESACRGRQQRFRQELRH